MKLKFRIKKTDCDDNDEIQVSLKAYRKHLDRFPRSSNSDLWKFFYRDFFHDGWVEYINIKDNIKTVEMKITCPNIKRLKDDGDFEYINVPFICVFDTVISFKYECDLHDCALDNSNNPTEYLYSEINTSPLLGSLQKSIDGLDYYSLLIQLLVGNVTTWMEIIFCSLSVVSCEPTAFALMEKDPNFDVPTYSEEKNG